VGTAFFFKQWGAWAPATLLDAAPIHARAKTHAFADCAVFKVGKKIAGRQLDGRTHDEYPA
jgi:protein gp37